MTVAVCADFQGDLPIAATLCAMSVGLPRETGGQSETAGPIAARSRCTLKRMTEAVRSRERTAIDLRQSGQRLLANDRSRQVPGRSTC